MSSDTASRPASGPDQRRPDDDPERERYRELLEELRTVLPGVQILFAFLLTVPFNSRFTELDAFGTRLYGVALAASALAAASFTAPPWYHRLDGGQPRGRRLHRSVLFQLGGLSLLFVAMASVLLLVSRFIFGSTAGGLIVALFVAGATVAWWLVPALDRLRHGTGHEDTGPPDTE